MVGNIIEPINVGGSIGPVDPDDYFDPVTHIATEENFIKFLECEVYDSKYIGYGVQLSNSVEYNNGVWIIADVDHDSANTSQSNCYDLISQDCFHNITYSSSSPYNDWRYSNPRTWLNNTFYPGFSSNLKSRMIKPKYNSRGIWYNDDYMVLLSKVEVNGGNASYTDTEGVPYPIFTGNAGTSANASRIKKYEGSATSWGTRSRYVDGDYDVWYSYSDGSMTTGGLGVRFYLAPLMRVQ